MVNSSPNLTPETAAAFAAYDQKATFHNLKVACILGMLLMPLGVVLDYFVYPKLVFFFLLLRMGCSFLIGLFFGIVVTPFGQRHYRKLGVVLAMFPSLSMSLMIAVKDGANSATMPLTDVKYGKYWKILTLSDLNFLRGELK